MKFSAAILVVSFFALCVASNDNGGFSLVRENDSFYRLVLETGNNRDVWELRYPVYRFCTGDIDGDNIADAIVGVEKTTRFDPVVRKRVFMFRNIDGKVRPLWMGSSLGHPVVDFNVVKINGETRLRSIEEESNGKYLVAEYRWESFGVKFIRSICRDSELDISKKFLNNE